MEGGVGGGGDNPEPLVVASFAVSGTQLYKYLPAGS